MRDQLIRIQRTLQAVTDRLPGGDRRRALRGRTRPKGLSELELARLQASSDQQAGIASSGHIGTTGGPGMS